MTEPTKSVLLVDYDSLHHSLAASGGDAALRLAARAPDWVNAIADGTLPGLGGPERQLPVKRCYVSPTFLSAGGAALGAAGFVVTECVPPVRGSRPADIHFALDAMQAAADPAHYGEFILLSAEPALAPLLARLKNPERRIVLFADAATPAGQRALADQILEASTFAEFLLAGEVQATVGPNRNDIESFARKIHTATNIPLLSPKAYAELFRFLSDEITANGYHFQSTAKNVADGLAGIGRSITRRQVVFVVKGLALKGHVFSSVDTPRQLAEAFREQARYLISGAGLTLEADQERLLGAWLVDRVPVTAARKLPEPLPQSSKEREPAPARAAPPAKPISRETPAAAATRSVPAATASTPMALKPTVEAPGKPVTALTPPTDRPVASAQKTAASSAISPAAEKPPVLAAQVKRDIDRGLANGKSAPVPQPAQSKDRPAETQIAAGKSVDEAATRPKAGDAADTSPEKAPAAGPTRKDTAPAAKPVQRTPGEEKRAETKPSRGMISPHDAKAAIVARVTSARIKPPAPAKPAEEPPPAKATKEPAAPISQDSIESSILAAIAEAVDVLVEDSDTTEKPPAKAQGVPPPQPPASPPHDGSLQGPTPETVQDHEDDGSDDIGNEIQRIIAIYNRTRKETPRR
jgi:hypothetical protein